MRFSGQVETPLLSLSKGALGIDRIPDGALLGLDPLDSGL
jgi:hypothetical protein